MALPKTERNPFLRRSPGERLKDAGKSLLRVPNSLYHGYRNWPKNLRYIFTGLAGLVLVLGLVFGFTRYQKWSTNKEVAAEWQALEAEYRKGTRDPSIIRKHLDRIYELDPDNPKVQLWKKAVTDGISDPTDAPQWMFVIGEHQKYNRSDEVVREATRRLESVPKDYYAHYLLARAALEKKDLKTAEPHLDALANPEGNIVNLSPYAASEGLRFLAGTRRDSTRLRTFIAERFNPYLRADWVENASFEEQFLLLHLYAESLALPKPPQNATLYVDHVTKLMGLVFQKAKERSEAVNLRNVGILGEELMVGLARLHGANQLSTAKFEELAVNLDRMNREAWELVMARDPKLPEAYFALTELHFRHRRYNEAIASLEKGLEQCGDSPLLLEKYWQVAMQSSPMLGHQRLKQAAERSPKTTQYWARSAQAAAAANRRDLAIETLDLGLKQEPDNLELIMLKAAMFTGTSRPEKVLQTLAHLSDDKLASYPNACSIVARAIGEIGDQERLDYFLAKAQEVSTAVNRPEPPFTAAAGLLESENLTTDRALQVADYIKPVADKWKRELPAAAQLYAKALFRAIELKPGPIDVALGQRCINACEAALLEDPNHVATAAHKMFLRLRSEKNPIKALEEIGPLIAQNSKDHLTPEQAEVLGMVYVANQRYEDAIRVLVPYTSGRPTAGCWVQLALAYHGQGRTSDAQGALRRASELSRSDREQGDYLAARSQLSQVKP